MEKNTFYKAYLQEKKQKEKDKKTIQKYNLSNDDKTIIVNQNSNKLIKSFSLILDMITKILKLIVIIVIIVLVTIGATVVLNKDLLNYILNYIGW